VANQASKREQVAAALASGTSICQASATGGVSERTVYNWMRDEEFAARVQELSTEMVRQAVLRVSSTMIAAVEQLNCLLDVENAQVRLGAARTILEQAVRLRESVTFEERLRALEAAEAARVAKGAGK
jgi:hypothetical protein